MFLLGHIGITTGIFVLFEFLRPDIRIRYWCVGLGAILPDIIDKLFGRVLFADSIASGRLVAHTFIFSLIFFLTGYFLYKRSRNTSILFVSGATFLHIVGDRMWTEPRILFWPLLGWRFPQSIYEDIWINYFLKMFKISFTPAFSFDFISELIGFISVIFIIVYFIRNKK